MAQAFRLAVTIHQRDCSRSGETGHGLPDATRRQSASARCPCAVRDDYQLTRMTSVRGMRRQPDCCANLISIFRGVFDVVDGEDLNLVFLRFELESELFLHRSEQGWAIGIDRLPSAQYLSRHIGRQWT